MTQHRAVGLLGTVGNSPSFVTTGVRHISMILSGSCFDIFWHFLSFVHLLVSNNHSSPITSSFPALFQLYLFPLPVDMTLNSVQLLCYVVKLWKLWEFNSTLGRWPWTPLHYWMTVGREPYCYVVLTLRTTRKDVLQLNGGSISLNMSIKAKPNVKHQILNAFTAEQIQLAEQCCSVKTLWSWLDQITLALLLLWSMDRPGQ